MSRKGGPVWVTLLCAIILGQAGAVVYNTSSPEECQVPTMPPEPTIPECAPNATATLDEAIARAWEFAPVVHTHILEPWHLQDPALFWNNSELYLSDGLPYLNSSYTFMMDDPLEFMMLSPKSYITVINNTALTKSEIDSILAGAPFDANNHSTAKVAFTVVEDPPNFFSYNFNLFYSWNGCSNQAIALTLDGKKNITNYVMCPPDVHEAGWERVSVLVCKSDWTVKRMAFSQHAWAQEVDCTVPGECTVDPETGHFSTFAGLYSHANYPRPSPMWVYAFVNGSISANVSLNNLNGLYIVDRNEPDPYRKWVPKPELLTYIPPLGEQDNATATRWTRYAGNWGAPLALPQITLTCMNANQTETFPCPEDDEAVTIILQFTKLVQNLTLPLIGQLGGTGEGYSAKSVDNSTRVGYPGITGPLTHAYSYEWYARPIPFIQSTNITTLLCPSDVPVGQDVPTITPDEFTASATTLTNYIIWVAVGDLCFSLFLILILCLPAVMDRSARVQKLVMSGVGAAGRAAKHTASGIGRGAAVVDAAIPGHHARAEVVGAVEAGMEAGVGAVGAGVGAVERGVGAGVGAVEAGVGAGVGAVERGAAAILAPLKSETIPDEEAAATAAHAATAAAQEPTPSGPFRRPLPSFSDNASASKEDISVKGSYIALDAKAMEERADGGRFSVRWIVWFVMGAGMFISGLVLAILGVIRLFNDSVVSAALDQVGASSVAQTIYDLLIALLSIIGFFDLFVIYVLYFMFPERLDFGRWKPHNPLGGWRWARTKAWEIYLASIGIMVLVVNVCTLLFALGFVITVVQILTRIACNKAMDVSVLGESLVSLCINVPFVNNGGEVCGWEILELCANVTTLDVVYLMFGAMLLTWCHLIWLISMVVLLEEQRQLKVYIKRVRSEEALGISGEGEATEYGSDVTKK